MKRSVKHRYRRTSAKCWRPGCLLLQSPCFRLLSLASPSTGDACIVRPHCPSSHLYWLIMHGSACAGPCIDRHTMCDADRIHTSPIKMHALQASQGPQGLRALSTVGKVHCAWCARLRGRLPAKCMTRQAIDNLAYCMHDLVAQASRFTTQGSRQAGAHVQGDGAARGTRGAEQRRSSHLPQVTRLI